MREKYLIANWKMNMMPNDVLIYIEKYSKNIESLIAKKIKNIEDRLIFLEDFKTIIAVPYINMFYSNLAAQDTKIEISAQNLHPKESGAYTGEISANMLKAIDIDWSLIGHSERRLIGEDNSFLKEKILATKREKIRPIFCIGESLEEMESGNTISTLEKQITEVLNADELGEFQDEIVIAYEPVWAIGTGKICDPETANNIINKIREILKNNNLNSEIPILYGGSVKADNIDQYINENIDGVLVGGASLDVFEFSKMLNSYLDYYLKYNQQ